jgi:hypothetical protein
MTPQEKSQLLASYNRRKNAGLLSARLAQPVRSGIKKECIKLYREGQRPEGAAVLKQFFKKNPPEDFAVALEEIDIDRFRPTADLLNGRNFAPEEKHYELISWLLGPELPDSSRNGSDDEQETTSEKGDKAQENEVDKPFWPQGWQRMTAATAALVLLACGAWLITPGDRQCMYWDGSSYHTASCDIQGLGKTVYALDQGKLDRFKKVLRPDTLTKASVGKLWYFKANRKLELFTDSGMHPVYTNRRLLPLSNYLIEKYLIKRK